MQAEEEEEDGRETERVEKRMDQVDRILEERVGGREERGGMSSPVVLLHPLLYQLTRNRNSSAVESCYQRVDPKDESSVYNLYY